MMPLVRHGEDTAYVGLPLDYAVSAYFSDSS